jgi:hypothetical protein
MERKLSLLQERFAAKGFKTTLVYYSHFDAALLDMGISGLLYYPVFLYCGYDASIEQWLLAVYDVVTQQFKLIFCNQLVKNGNYLVNDKIVCTDVLKVCGNERGELDMEDLITIVAGR